MTKKANSIKHAPEKPITTGAPEGEQHNTTPPVETDGVDSAPTGDTEADLSKLEDEPVDHEPSLHTDAVPDELEDIIVAKPEEGKTAGIAQLIAPIEVEETPINPQPAPVNQASLMFADDLATTIEAAGNHDCTPGFVAALKAQVALYRGARRA